MYTIDTIVIWGVDGGGFSCDLLRDGKKVAECYKGEEEEQVDISWFSPEIGKYDHCAQQEFMDFLDSLEPVQLDSVNEPIRVDPDLYIKRLIEEAKSVKMGDTSSTRG